jgi:RNA polymerase sigma-70 factor (ECF subfamily)
MPEPPDPPDRVLARYQAYLECLTYIQIDPRLWRRFGWSDVVNQTLLEAHRELDRLQALGEAERGRRLRRMLLNNLRDRIERERAAVRDYRREEALAEALAGSSASLQRALGADTPGPPGRAEEAERAARLAQALTQLPPREREALILQQYHGWTLEQIGAHLGCTANAVAGLHARGLKRLSRLLSDLNEEG